MEDRSKNCSGGIKQIWIQNKNVTLYEDLNAGDWCYVTILNQYILKVPKNLNEQGDFIWGP